MHFHESTGSMVYEHVFGFDLKCLTIYFSQITLNGSCGHRMSISSQNTICKVCSADHYWHQMDKRCFFIVMLDDNFKNGLVRPTNYAVLFHQEMSSTMVFFP